MKTMHPGESSNSAEVRVQIDDEAPEAVQEVGTPRRFARRVMLRAREAYGGDSPHLFRIAGAALGGSGMLAYAMLNSDEKPSQASLYAAAALGAWAGGWMGGYLQTLKQSVLQLGISGAEPPAPFVRTPNRGLRAASPIRQPLLSESSRESSNADSSPRLWRSYSH